jgi:hypothetical protein
MTTSNILTVFIIEPPNFFTQEICPSAARPSSIQKTRRILPPSHGGFGFIGVISICFGFSFFGRPLKI